MTTSAKLSVLLIYVVTLIRIEGSYFIGGTITYKVLNATESIVTISLTQTYLYTYTEVPCDDDMIRYRSITLFSNISQVDQQATLNCTLYCNQSGGYQPIPIDSFCTDYSIILNVTVGQRSDEINITSGSYFRIGFVSREWRSLHLPNASSDSNEWSVSCLINLRIRSNGTYNHPPVSTMISPIYIPLGLPQAILIPTIDADNDEVRCRFANGSDECGDVCPSESLPNGATLRPDCILLITGMNVSDWYAVTIMIEDFVDSNSIDPLSSIPVQFLINVQNKTDCSPPLLAGPVIDSGQCVGVFVGQQHSIVLTAENFCSNATTIQDIAILSFPNVIKTPIIQNTTSLWSVLLVWTPTVEQVGSQVLCAVATDSNNVQSNQYCITFTVAEGSISLCPGETIMQTTESTTIDSTSILMTSVSTPDASLTSRYDDQASVNTMISSTVDLKQSMTTSLASNIQSTFSTSKPINSTINLYETSATTTLSRVTLTSSTYFQNSSTSYQKIDSNYSTVVPPSSNSAFPWYWVAPLIASVGVCLIAFCIWCCFCYRSCCCFARHQNHPPANKISQQSKNIRLPKRSYKVYNVSKKEQTSRRNNVHKSRSLDKTNNQTSRTASTPTSPPLNNVTPDTPTSVTQSYIFDNSVDKEPWIDVHDFFNKTM